MKRICGNCEYLIKLWVDTFIDPEFKWYCKKGILKRGRFEISYKENSRTIKNKEGCIHHKFKGEK